jgi:hypothetical protein
VKVFIVRIENTNADVVAEGIPVKPATGYDHGAPRVWLVVRTIDIRAAREAMNIGREMNSRPPVNQSALGRKDSAIA